MANNIPPSKTLETALATLGMSVFRALALDGDGDALVAQFLRLREAAPDSFTKSVQLPASVALALFDLTDDQKRLIARKAEAAGLWGLAYGLSTVQSEFDDLVALLDRMPESELGAGEGSPPEKRIALLRQAVSLADIRIVPLDMAIQPLEVQKIAAARQGAGVMRSFARLSFLAPDLGFLPTLFNQTGEIRLATEIAPAVLAEIEAKRLNPVGRPDAIVADLITRLDLILGAQNRAKQLRSFDWFQSSRRRASTMAERVDTELVRFALAPLIRAETTEAPSMPDGIAVDFDWMRWVRIARDLGSHVPVIDADRLIAADLLIGAERAGEALDMLRLTSSQDAARKPAYDLMIRLDRRCADLFAPTTPFADHIYRFDR